MKNKLLDLSEKVKCGDIDEKDIPYSVIKSKK